MASFEQDQPTDPAPYPLPDLIAWETPQLPLGARITKTLAAGFFPHRSAHSLAFGHVGPSLRFATLFALPFMLTWAIIPFTHTLRFGPSLGIEVLNAADGRSQVADLLQAVGISLGLSLVSLAAWAVPLASLLKAFCPAPELAQSAHVGGLRAALYSAWLVPVGLNLFWFAFWALPARPGSLGMELLLLVFQLLPRIVVLSHGYAVAQKFGIRGGARLLVVLVPLAVEWAVGLPLTQLLSKLAPEIDPGPAHG